MENIFLTLAFVLSIISSIAFGQSFSTDSTKRSSQFEKNVCRMYKRNFMNGATFIGQFYRNDSGIYSQTSVEVEKGLVRPYQQEATFNTSYDSPIVYQTKLDQTFHLASIKIGCWSFFWNDFGSSANCKSAKTYELHGDFCTELADKDKDAFAYNVYKIMHVREDL